MECRCARTGYGAPASVAMETVAGGARKRNTYSWRVCRGKKLKLECLWIGMLRKRKVAGRTLKRNDKIICPLGHTLMIVGRRNECIFAGRERAEKKTYFSVGRGKKNKHFC